MKRISKFVLVLTLSILVVSSFATPAHAEYKTKSETFNWYSIVGYLAATVVFYAEGNAVSGSGGTVSNMYFQHAAHWPNYVKGATTWKSPTPYGQKANGSVRLGTKIGISDFSLQKEGSKVFGIQF